MALDVPALSSLAGANHTIFLDFDGHVTEGTSWNSYFSNPSIKSPAYSTDGDATSYSSAELNDMHQAWQRIAEDFLPFAVNVTTVDPGVEALRKTGGSDTKWGIRVVITADTEASGAGGIAYVDSFNWSSDTPAFVYVTTGKYIAEAGSHEAGHTLGLAHDGQGGSAYYYGHGSGATSWAPLMGVGYYAEVTQWDRGEFSGANNGGAGANYGKGRNDLAVIATYNGFGFRADDHGDTIAAPSALASSGGALSGSGIIAAPQDVDVFGFTTGAGNVTLNISPAALGPNLDVRAELLDAAGNVIASANPAETLAATLSLNLAAGTYFLRIDGTGVGNPSANPPTGYTDYGSIGQYAISGQVVDAGGLAVLTVGDAIVSEAAGQASFTVTLAGTITAPVTVGYSTADDSALAGSDYTAAAGTLTFEPGGPAQQTLAVPILGDTAWEPTERFFLRLENASAGAMIGDGQGEGTITDNDVALSIGNRTAREGSPRGRKGSGIQLTLFTFTVSLTGPAPELVSVSYNTISGSASAGSDYLQSSGTVAFAPGETTKTIEVNVVADTTSEPDEGFQVVLSSPVGADLAGAVGDGMIQDDDAKGGGKNNVPSVGIAKPGKATSPAALKPVRDVFAWQSATRHENEHQHAISSADQEHGLSHFAAFQSAPSSGPALPTRAEGLASEAATDQLLTPASRRDWLIPSQPARSNFQAVNDVAIPASRDAEPDDDNWLELLARDRHMHLHPIGLE